MPSRARRPISVVLSDWIVGVAALLTPNGQRDDWKREWHAEIWHRWQFLRHAGAWDRREKFGLVRGTLGAFQDAAWLLKSHEALWQSVREYARSPFMCLGALGVLLLVTAVLTGGFPATRELLSARGNLLFIWTHPSSGGRDKGLPPDLTPAWASHSRELAKIAAFQIGPPAADQPLLVTVQPQFFDVIGVRPAIGSIPREGAVVLDHRAWQSLLHASPNALGAPLKIGTVFYPVAAVLPRNFWILSRQPTIYLVRREITSGLVFAVARAKPGVSRKQLDKELVKIAEDVCYYTLDSQLRYAAWTSVLLTPLRLFGVALLLAGLMAPLVFRFRLRAFRLAAVRRSLFFTAKASLALAWVFALCLELSRSESAILLASKDPGDGPFLVWLYVLGTMGVLFWAVADQRSRCRVCLRLLAFPVRVGCPGCLLLDWSGTELFCSEGHGVLHVPHMAPSWDEDAERWISLDESWQGLFAARK
jgi:MacB-like protein